MCYVIYIIFTFSTIEVERGQNPANSHECRSTMRYDFNCKKKKNVGFEWTYFIHRKPQAEQRTNSDEVNCLHGGVHRPVEYNSRMSPAFLPPPPPPATHDNLNNVFDKSCTTDNCIINTRKCAVQYNTPMSYHTVLHVSVLTNHHQALLVT